MFIDEVVIELTSGSGGDGALSFHREKFVPRGGPDGADGGRGGDVTLVADRSKRTLYDFKFQARFKAEDGTIARSNKNGKNGGSIEIRVPVGTVVFDSETGEPLADLDYHGAKFLACKGGRGGFGNLHYVSSVRQVPNFAQKGEPGETLSVKLELKLLAEIGIIGLPNAGKSTLISRISAAKPKIADYPFTTIVPNLGVVSVGDTSFTVADMPGLIEGASEGHGLGHQFLRHIERTVALIHLIEISPIDGSDPSSNYTMVERELRNFSEPIAERPRIVVLSKLDTVDSELADMITDDFTEKTGIRPYRVSSASGQGIEPVLYRCVELLEEAASRPVVTTLFPATERKDDSGFWDVIKTESGFEVVGKRIDRLVAMTDLENHDAVRFMHRKLERIGVINKLRELGAQDGDEVCAGDFVFTFEDDR